MKESFARTDLAGPRGRIIDESLPIPSVQSLEALATMLSQVEDQPPVRKSVLPPIAA